MPIITIKNQSKLLCWALAGVQVTISKKQKQKREEEEGNFRLDSILDSTLF